MHTPFSPAAEGLARQLFGGTALGLCLSTFAAAAAAQNSPEAPAVLPAITVEGVQPATSYKPERVTSPKFTQPLVDTPKTITIVPKELIEDRGATSITDALRTVPGISLGAGEGGIAAGDRTFIRGYDARGDNFVDGARDFGTYFRDPFNIEQVEVLKGPGSAYAGRGSTGGAINYVTKAPTAENFVAGTLGIGTDLTKRATADVNQVVTEGTAVRLNAMVQDGDVAGRDEVRNRRWGIAPSLAVGLGGPTTLTLSYFHLEQDNVPDYGHPFNTTTGLPVDVDQENFYGLTGRDYDRAHVHMGSVRLEHRFDDSLTLRNQLRFGYTDRDLIVTKPAPVTSGATTVTRDARSRDSIYWNVTNQTDVTAEFSTFGVGHTLVTGVELVREFLNNRPRTITAAPPADLAHPNPDDFYAGSISHSGAKTAAKVDTLAFYAFDTLKLTEQLLLMGGLRFDRIDTRHKSIAVGGAETRLGREDNLLSGSGAVVFKPLPNGSVYFAYGTSFNPSAEFVALAENTANVAPEENKSYEVGTKWDLFDERLSLSFALFRTEKTNARVSDPLGGPDLLLDGANRVNGFEIGIAGSLTERWEIFGGYAFLDSKITKSTNPDEVGKDFANIPRHNFSVWTTYKVLTDVEVGFGASYQSERYANNLNTLRLPDYWRFDAMASYRINENVAVRLNVLNITDELYYDSTHNGQHALVAPGRSALLTTSFKF